MYVLYAATAVALAARDDRRARAAAPRQLTDDRRIIDAGTSDIDASVAKIAAEFRAGFEKVAEIDRPAVALFGSARVSRGQRAVRVGAHRRPQVRRGRLGGRHRRRAAA